jgi:hypothetical protein
MRSSVIAQVIARSVATASSVAPRMRAKAFELMGGRRGAARIAEL